MPKDHISHFVSIALKSVVENNAAEMLLMFQYDTVYS